LKFKDSTQGQGCKKNKKLVQNVASKAIFWLNATIECFFRFLMAKFELLFGTNHLNFTSGLNK
jgi:hypothetical protein